MHFCRYLHDDYLLDPETVEALEREVYQYFYGGGEPDDRSPPATADDDANTIRAALQRIYASTSLAPYTRDNRPLCRRIAHDAVSWCNNQLAQAPEDPELEAEARRHQELRTTASLETLSREAARDRPELSRRAALYRDQAAKNAADPRYVARIQQRMAELWAQQISTQKRRTRDRRLERGIGAFVSELQAVVPHLAGRQHTMRDLFGSDNALFDSSLGEWQTGALDALEDAVATLRTAPEIADLARVIGRSRMITQDRRTFTEIRRERLEAVGVGKGEVTGIHAGDDLTAMIAAEAALLASPPTEDLFFAKLAAKQLLGLQFRSPRLVRTTTVRRVPVTVPTPVRRGPAIVCIDTSGSMLGEPERVAKALALALAYVLRELDRDLYLIAFSTQIRTLHVDPRHPDTAAVLSFLTGGFHGGTDLRPALEEALRVLTEERFSRADVVVLSDFRVPKIADRFQRRIQEEQDRETVFHSVTVARGPVADPHHIFDAHWLYDLSRPHPGIDPAALARVW